jgi:Ser/Thr protein kinase RdoA (MazF antagonist)
VRVWTSLGFPVVGQYPLSRSGAARAFRLDLRAGGCVKGRIFPSPAWAARVERLLILRRARGLPQPLARSGRFLVLEFVEGTPLDEWLARHAQEVQGQARKAGAWLGQLHRGTRLRDRAPAPARYEQRMRAVVGRMSRMMLLSAEIATVIGRLRAPSSAAVALTHGDICPENLIRTPGGSIRPIDEERLAVRPLAYDLARAVNRWPLDAKLEKAFLDGYKSAGGRPEGFVRHRAFWIAAALATSAEYRLHEPSRLRPIVDAMRDLARDLDTNE